MRKILSLIPFILGLLWPDSPQAATVACQGINDTAAIQAAVNLENTVLEGDCRINGATPVKVPAARQVLMTGAMVTMLPGCARQSPPCTLFQSAANVVGTVEFVGGTLVGSLDPAIGSQILIRFGEGIVPAAGQKFSGIVRGVTFRNARTDFVHVGGNTQPRGILITGNTFDTFGRNAVSVVNAKGVWFQHNFCRNAVLIAGFNQITPGACIDGESNPGSDLVEDLTISDNWAEDVEICWYLHKNINAPAMGRNYDVSNNVCMRARSTWFPPATVSGGICTVVNSSENVRVSNNVCDGAVRIGTSIGAFGESTRANHVYITGNKTLRTPRGLVIAGARDIHVIGNTMSDGAGNPTQAETVALGVRPPFTLQEPVPTPAPTPTPAPCQ